MLFGVVAKFSMKNAVYYNGRLEKDYFLHFLEKAIRPVRHISTVVEAEELIYTNQVTGNSLDVFHRNGNEDGYRYCMIQALS